MNSINKTIFIFLFSIISLLALNTCKEKPNEPPILPPPDVNEPIMTLELEDAHCTEVWLQLKTQNIAFPTNITIKQINQDGDSTIKYFGLYNKDSLLYIDSLLPKKRYRFKAEAIINNKLYATNQVAVQTMDTTSHNFTFEMFTFGGEIGSSVLYDVAIINENNIWAVGDIWIKSDTSQTGYVKYNAVHWDGTEWKLHRIMFYTVCGQTDKTVYPARSIFVFNENDIWISMLGSQIVRLNGTIQLSTYCLPFSFVINKLWGSSNSNMYAVGSDGNIAWYNGTSWRRIESGTTLNLNDIWGDYNPKTNQWEILAVASNYPASINKEILKIVGATAFKLPTSSQMEPLYTVWFIPNKQYYVAGSGIYQKRLLTDLNWKNGPTDITTFATTSIRGNGINDVIGVGAFGDFLHFNGVNWKSDYLEPLLSNGSFGSVAVKGNLIAATGYNNREAVILIGRR